MKRNAPYMAQSLSFKISTHQTMTPQLQEAIRLLQLSYDDLLPFIEDQIVMNPFLKENESEAEGQDDFGLLETYGQSSSSKDKTNILEASIPERPQDFYLGLVQQVERLFSAKNEKKIALYLLDMMDASGYLKITPEKVLRQFRITRPALEIIIKRLQSCEPTGVFARTLQECLTLQLEERGDLDEKYRTLLDYLSPLMRGDIKKSSLLKKLRVTEDQLSRMFRVIRSLRPKPLISDVVTADQYVTPEVIVFLDKKTQEWLVTLNPTLRSTVSFDESYYRNIKSQLKNGDEKRYVTQQASHANWLRKALLQRNQTLLNVASEIVRQQQDFFHKGVGYLKPIILQDVATPLGIHESTVSRITNKKYLLTPYGTIELKYFFTTGFENPQGQSVSSESLRRHVEKLIKQERPQKPLSDSTITTLLNKQGISIARRTVAKYRESLQIPPSFQRKRSYHFS